MAYYRQIYTTFWTDAKVADDFTPEDKYFYLYLLTNAHTNLSGCYEISKKQISVDTGYTIDVVTRLLDRMQNVHEIAAYSDSTKEVLLYNWHKYNWSKSDKVLKGVANEYERIKNPEFRQEIYNLLADYGYKTDTLSIPYAYPMHTSVTVTVSNTVTDTVSDTVSDTEVETSFDKFWKAYPKKVGKKEAKKAFDRAKKTTDVDTMIQAVIAQKGSSQWARDNGRYIPNPATWLNQGRWDDELQAEVKPKLKNAPSMSHGYTEDEWAELRRRAKE